MDEYSGALLTAVDAALGPWVERCVETIAVAYFGSMSETVRQHAMAAGLQARADVGASLRALFDTDVDHQRTSPLSIIRGAVRYPTAVLHAAGVAEVVRPEFEERAFPDDPYGLTPATWSDLDASVHEPGMMWGAWKARLHLTRRAAARGS